MHNIEGKEAKCTQQQRTPRQPTWSYRILFRFSFQFLLLLLFDVARALTTFSLFVYCIVYNLTFYKCFFSCTFSMRYFIRLLFHLIISTTKSDEDVIFNHKINIKLKLNIIKFLKQIMRKIDLKIENCSQFSRNLDDATFNIFVK